MKTLKQYIQEKLDIEKRMADARSVFEAQMRKESKELQNINEHISMQANSINTELVDIAEQVIEVYGKVNSPEREHCVERAIEDVTSGINVLRAEYFGTKDYGHWSDQNITCKYGYCPSHGSVVFSVGLTQKYQYVKAMFDDATLNAVLYYLLNIKKIQQSKGI